MKYLPRRTSIISSHRPSSMVPLPLGLITDDPWCCPELLSRISSSFKSELPLAGYQTHLGFTPTNRFVPHGERLPVLGLHRWTQRNPLGYVLGNNNASNNLHQLGRCPSWRSLCGDGRHGFHRRQAWWSSKSGGLPWAAKLSLRRASSTPRRTMATSLVCWPVEGPPTPRQAAERI